MKEIKITYKNNKPYGIRDEGGFLLFFPSIIHFSGQEERYRKDIEKQNAFADKLKEFLTNK